MLRAADLSPSGAFPLRSPSKPLLLPSLSHFAAELGDSTLAVAAPSPEPSFARVLWSAAEAVLALPRIEKPGEKGGDGIYVERTLLDAFLPFNATLSVALAFVTSSATELTRTNKINDLVVYLAGEEPDDGSGEASPPSLPWEWDRVGHDTVANFTKDAGSQTLTRYIERNALGSIGSGASYCELLKHAHKAACKEYQVCRADGAVSASLKAAKIVATSPTFYCVRGLTVWLADISVDAVAWWRGQLDTATLKSNAYLKAAKYSLSAVLCLALGVFVPFLYPHPYVFIGVEQLAANIIADTFVAKLGTIEPS